ncbi:MAG: cyclic nucleotide-binding domain-containing protein [Pseudomonadota bacterium]
MSHQDVIAKLVARLEPLKSFTDERRAAVTNSATLVRMEGGQLICREGDRDRYCIYLVKGSVETLSGGQVVKRIDAGTPIAMSPIAEHQPRTLSVRTCEAVGLLRVPRELMSGDAQSGGEESGIALSELDEADDSADDWMTMLLRSPLYSQLPVTNIQQIMAQMESVTLNRGDVIVRQDELGDYFYFLSRGRARVIRQAREGEPPVMLAELSPGVSFGEEALVAGLPRNATVSMLTEGRVMRLAKATFEELILEPTLNRLSWVDAETLVANGARWLDVRFPDEFEDDGLENAVNVPLGMLRMRMSKLDRDAEYVVYCDDGKRSAAGAFLMAGSAFNVHVLDGGITTPDGIDTMDTGELGTGPGASPFDTVLSVSSTPEPEPEATPEPPAPPPTAATEQIDQSAAYALTDKLKEQLSEAVQSRTRAELQTETAQAELRATQEALKSERERAREMAREMQQLRQTLTDIQRQAHDALMRERSVYERELTQAVENLEQALLEKEMVLEVERAKNQEEVARLRRLLEATGKATG